MSVSAAGGAAAHWFAECYAAEPDGVWHAPGRVNLIGEHTDYNDGFVLPFALAQGVRAAASPRDDGMLELRSHQAPDAPAAVRLDALAPGRPGGWAAYPAGVAWALLATGSPVRGASIAIDADLERGAALSSSAALECATALALTEMYGLSVDRRELATLARRAENEFVGVPSGIMDQSASLLCERGHALLLDCRSGETSAVPLDLAAAGLVLLVIDTQIRHALSDGRYAERRRSCEDAARALGVASLRDVTDAPDGVERVEHLGDPVLRRRARHVVTENARVLETAGLLRVGEPTRIGPLLTASHGSLRDDFEISWPQADAAVEAAIGSGALGARMTGGGFGGSVIALVPAPRGGDVRAGIEDAYATRGWKPPRFLDALPSAGAHRLR
ncbi:MAG TPA: galactokinase [Streptosporangiaceae bacterium]|nr:galactokinase [Streptosporangiaceae bacterium]